MTTEETTMPLTSMACAMRSHSACKFPGTCQCHCHTGVVDTSGHVFTCGTCGQPGLRATEVTEHQRVCPGHFETHVEAEELHFNPELHLDQVFLRRPGSVSPCSCECNSGGFCGGCGHVGCGGRR